MSKTLRHKFLNVIFFICLFQLNERIENEEFCFCECQKFLFKIVSNTKLFSLLFFFPLLTFVLKIIPRHCYIMSLLPIACHCHHQNSTMIMYHDHDPVPDHIINQIFFWKSCKKRKNAACYEHDHESIYLYIQKQIWLMLMHAAAPAPVAITDVRVWSINCSINWLIKSTQNWLISWPIAFRGKNVVFWQTNEGSRPRDFSRGTSYDSLADVDALKAPRNVLVGSTISLRPESHLEDRPYSRLSVASNRTIGARSTTSLMMEGRAPKSIEKPVVIRMLRCAQVQRKWLQKQL